MPANASEWLILCVPRSGVLLRRQPARFLHHFCSECPGSKAAPLHPPFMLVQSLLSCLFCLSLLLRKLGWLLLITVAIHSLPSRWKNVPQNLHVPLYNAIASLISFCSLYPLMRMGRVSRNVAEISAASCCAESSEALTNTPRLLGCMLAWVARLLCRWLHNQLVPGLKLNYILCIGSRGAGTVCLEGCSSVIHKEGVCCSD